MAKNETIRIRPNFLQADEDAYTALLSIGNYAPINEDYFCLRSSLKPPFIST